MTNRGRHSTLLIAAILCQQTLGSMTFPVAKLGLATLEPFIFAFYRFMTAAAVLLCIVRCVRYRNAIARADCWRIIGQGILIILLNQTTYLLGQSLTTASHGALLFATTPVWICILARLHLKESLTRRRAAGILLALGGVAIIMSQDAPDLGVEHL